MDTYEVTYEITNEDKITTFHAKHIVEAKTPIRAVKFLSTPMLNYGDTLTITCVPASNMNPPK
jgi:hypothetical protein